MICPDCKGSGKYDPLVGPSEDCRACGGSGEVTGGHLVTMDMNIGVKEIDPVMTTYRRADIYMALAQRWDTAQSGLVAGKFYMWEPGCAPQMMGDGVQLKIAAAMEKVFRLEYPSKGFRLYLPGQSGYDDLEKRYGSDPCIETGALLTCEWDDGIRDFDYEFYASDDTMGISFREFLVAHTPSRINIQSYYDNNLNTYRPQI